MWQHPKQKNSWLHAQTRITQRIISMQNVSCGLDQPTKDRKLLANWGIGNLLLDCVESRQLEVLECLNSFIHFSFFTGLNG